MHSAWLRGYKDKKARAEQIKSAAWAFGLLREVLEREFHKKENYRDYSDPNWANKQIAISEYNAALDDLLMLLDLED